MRGVFDGQRRNKRKRKDVGAREGSHNSRPCAQAPLRGREGATWRDELYLEKALRIWWEFGEKGEKTVEREKTRELNMFMPGALIPGRATFGEFPAGKSRTII